MEPLRDRHYSHASALSIRAASLRSASYHTIVQINQLRHELSTEKCTDASSAELTSTNGATRCLSTLLVTFLPLS